MNPTTSDNNHSPARRAILGAAGATALLSLLALASGCVVRPYPVATVYAPAPGPAYVEPEGVVVAGDPPPPQYEYVGIAPGPGYLWIGGYYHWSGAGWVWLGGHYERPPHPGARWIGPRYAWRGGARIYVRGYWR